ncbi:hypothetical protein [Amycolatopsis sp. MJM2582]|uniref:hypothetical protein n=1 Tax=Amycolatopsis sp. MJM2582 TaxID=1427749 RepID=UPI000AB6E48D|nr:hypothetical protein [Amycolatopsis sp. MJM2582]
MEWAKLHLRLADSINVGTNLVLAQRHHLDTGSRPMHEPYVRYEVEQWLDFLRARH